MKRLLDLTTNEGAAKFYMDTMLEAESAIHDISKSTEREIDERRLLHPAKKGHTKPKPIPLKNTRKYLLKINVTPEERP